MDSPAYVNQQMSTTFHMALMTFTVILLNSLNCQTLTYNLIKKFLLAGIPGRTCIRNSSLQLSKFSKVFCEFTSYTSTQQSAPR